MEDNIYDVKQMTEKSIQSGVIKANKAIWQTLLGGIIAGAFIALGACCSSLAMHGIADVGVARTLGGVVFPIGLILIIMITGELFTGNCMLIMGVIEKKFSFMAMLKNLSLVFIGNFIGSAIIAIMIIFSGQLDYSQNALGAYVIKVAIGKANLPFMTAFVSGILCNILVCAAVFLALAAKDAIGKILCIFFPIFVFVIAGFEHCVANMYYLLMGLLAAMKPEYADKAMEMYGLSTDKLASLNWSNIFIGNLLPVTIGNFVGGAIFFALPIYILIKGKKHK